jgi:transcriptional regulator
MVEDHRSPGKRAWHNSDAYLELRALPDVAWGWEFLRRNPNYIAVARERAPKNSPPDEEPDCQRLTSIPFDVTAGRWGLLCFRTA